ncbi:arginine--tRNA ligase, partial [Patescibacteria group bacterium]|nr:arginine--tRNA ligase [Patescibacteria group bacterium]
GEEFKLWQKTRKWSIKQFDEIYKELNINFKETFYESDFIEKGIKQIKELKDKKILIESENAIIADLNEYNLGVLVIMRSDGTALYPTADIPLAIYKLTKFKLDKSIIVVDVRQSLYFKQLFKLLELLGYKQEMIHLSYEFVKLPSGMMSSRTGNIITYTELKEKLINKAKNEIIKRHEKWSTRKINETANTLATAIMKFEMLKVDANQIINFDIEKSLKFEGYTAGYIEYTYARISSILKTFDKENIKLKLDSKTTNTLEDAKERDIILKIAKYPETIEKAAKTYNPSMLAKYLFELAQLINDYYHAIPILKANKERKNAKILLVKSSNQIIKNGLNLLGIEVLEEM